MLESCAVFPSTERQDDSPLRQITNTLLRLWVYGFTVILQTLMKGGACNNTLRSLSSLGFVEMAARGWGFSWEIQCFSAPTLILDLGGRKDPNKPLITYPPITGCRNIRTNSKCDSRHLSTQRQGCRNTSMDLLESLLKQQTNQTQGTWALPPLLGYHLVH